MYMYRYMYIYIYIYIYIGASHDAGWSKAAATASVVRGGGQLWCRVQGAGCRVKGVGCGV